MPLTSIEGVWDEHMLRVFVRVCGVCVCACVADVLCSLSDSQRYPAADTLPGRPACLPDWLTDWQVRACVSPRAHLWVGVCMCVCESVRVCVFSCVWTQGTLFCLQQINVPSRERRARVKEQERLRGRGASPGQTVCAPWTLSNRRPLFFFYY